MFFSHWENGDGNGFVATDMFFGERMAADLWQWICFLEKGWQRICSNRYVFWRKDGSGFVATDMLFGERMATDL